MNRNIGQSIDLIKAVITDENCQRMNKSNLKGYLGELFVLRKLEDEGCEVIHKGNQSGYDLLVDSNFTIDVKSSTIKGTKSHPDWGWALHIKTKKNINCSHFICVGFNENLDAEKYCVIKSENLELFPSASGRFNSVKRSFSLMLDGIQYPNNPYFSDCKKLVQEGKVQVIQSTEGLRSLL